jgi:hypothetical protein
VHADIIPLIVGILIFVFSLISLKLGISVAVIPTFVAQKWFPPAYSEDLVEWNNGR